MRKALIIGGSLLVLFFSGFIVFKFYDQIFSKKVHGQIVRVERVSDPAAIVGGVGAIPPSQLFSFAIAIKDETGEIHTASSEDRQWAVAQAGQCVDARFFPYPPWQLDKSGTYHGARLLRLQDCPAAR